jgi:methylthioribose-1-phosphate isomerase
MHTIQWKGDSVSILNQKLLPLREEYTQHFNYQHVADAIRCMEVRGAPAIGIAAAMGIALAARKMEKGDMTSFRERMSQVFDVFAGTRPTAVNLFWAIDRMRKILGSAQSPADAAAAMEREAQALLDAEIAATRSMGKNGSRFIADGM